MAWRAPLGILCAAGLALAQPATAQTDDLAKALALAVASGLTGARDAPKFAWVENAAGVRNIWIGERGGPARQVTDYAEDDGQPIYDLALSGDGASLAYVRGGDDEFPDGKVPNPASATSWPKQQVFVIAGGAAQLVGDGHLPVFAPAGDRLAFTHRGEIWLWDQAGGARKLATVAGEVTRLTWSPDGARLLFVDNRDDHSFVALLDLGGARVRYLDPGLDYSVEPAFSPDGRQVAFVRYREPPMGAAPDAGAFWSIRIADAATGAARTLWTAPRRHGQPLCRDAQPQPVLEPHGAAGVPLGTQRLAPSLCDRSQRRRAARADPGRVRGRELRAGDRPARAGLCRQCGRPRPAPRLARGARGRRPR